MMNSDDHPNRSESLSTAAEIIASARTQTEKKPDSVDVTYDWDYYRDEFQKIVEHYVSYTKKPDIELLSAAFHYSYTKHKGQKRKSGVPYFDHLIEVVKILVRQKMDAQTLAAAFLHDVIEDTSVTQEEIKSLFGDTILTLVDGVTKIGGIAFTSTEQTQGENYRKMLLSLIKDIRVIIIKLADRLHNMRTIDSLPKKKQERIAIETRDVYAPLAHRFGMARIRWELEDLVLKTLDNEAYRELTQRINENRVEREQYIETVSKPIREKLSDYNVEAQITGRPKHFFSIYNKMKKRGKPFEEIYDLLAIRVIVENKPDCYNALGVVHSTYKPVSERFKDYIATPKLNGYQSIHTTVVGPDGQRVEIQIRSREMHQIAEDGIAAHWLYKEQRLQPNQFDKHLTWIRQLIEQQSEPGEFAEELKIDLYRDEIFVFTPKGDLYQLPLGATPVDFAFCVHSDIGLHCYGATVNGRIVNLQYELSSGDQVDIKTSDQQTPSRHWLAFVKTSKARNLIKRYFRNSEMEQSISLGKEILAQELKTQGVKTALPELGDRLNEIAAEMKLETLDMLFSSVGRGNHSARSVVQKISGALPAPKTDNKKSLLNRLIRREHHHTASIIVNGVQNMMIHYASCCNPIPGDPILGYVTKGKGINIHRKDCANIVEAVKKEPERGINAVWKVSESDTFMVHLKVSGYDRKNFLSDITHRISQLDTNITSAEMKTAGNENVIDFILQVHSNSQLNKIIDNIRKVQGIIDVYRAQGFLFPGEISSDELKS